MYTEVTFCLFGTAGPFCEGLARDLLIISIFRFVLRFFCFSNFNIWVSESQVCPPALLFMNHSFSVHDSRIAFYDEKKSIIFAINLLIFPGDPARQVKISLYFDLFSRRFFWEFFCGFFCLFVMDLSLQLTGERSLSEREECACVTRKSPEPYTRSLYRNFFHIKKGAFCVLIDVWQVVIDSGYAWDKGPLSK